MANFIPNFDSFPVRSTFSITASTTNVNEGDTVTFTISSPNYGSGILYWSIIGTVNSADFSDALGLSGSIFKQYGTDYSVAKILSNDATFEGTETLQLILTTYSSSGTVLAVSPVVNVLDTSISPASILLVGGGGGGGNFYPVTNVSYPANAGGGGGGGGGVLVTSVQLPVTSTYYVIVGSGGIALNENNSGGSSQLVGKSVTVTANGGGGGGNNFVNISGTAYRNGAAGGSGGGGSSPVNRATGTFSTATTGGAATQTSPGKGNAGGGTGITAYNAGGGGGAGGAGIAGNAANSFGRGGAGYLIPAPPAMPGIPNGTSYLKFIINSSLRPSILSADLSVGVITTEPFTIEAWVYPRNLSVPNRDNKVTIIQNGFWYQGANGGWFLTLNFDGSVSLRYSLGEYNSLGNITTSRAGLVLINVWTHVAVVRDSSNYVSIYINGKLENTPTVLSQSLNLTYTTIYPAAKLTNIGANITDQSILGYDGNISNLRLVVGSAIYTGPFTPAGPLTTSSQGADPNQVRLLLNSGLIDNSIYNNSLIVDATSFVKQNTLLPTVENNISIYTNEIYSGGGDGWNAFQSVDTVVSGGGGLYNNGQPTNGVANTGGGGAGGTVSISAGNGGSGIVKIAYFAESPKYSGGIVTITNAYGTTNLIIHTFLNSGFLSNILYGAATFGVTASVPSVFEGDSITFTITTTNFNDGLLAWVITGVDSTVINGVMRSTVVISGGTASVIINTQNNAVTEGPRSLVFTVYTPDYVTSLTSTSVSVLENVIITVNTTSVNEPGTVTFTISSAAYSGVIYWSFAGSSGGITTGDFSDAAGLSGTVTISPGSPQTVTKNIVADQLTEGTELLWMSGCTGNYVTSGGILVAKSPYVTINDTSLNPPYVVSVSPTKGPKTGGTISSAAIYDAAGVVTITGTGFSDVRAVKFGGVSSASFTVVSSTQISAVPPPIPGITTLTGVDVQISIGPSYQTSSLNSLYTYVPPPTISSITPNSFGLDNNGQSQVAGTFLDNFINLVISTNTNVQVITALNSAAQQGFTFTAPVWPSPETATFKVNTYGGFVTSSITFANIIPAITSIDGIKGPIGGGFIATPLTNTVPVYNPSGTITLLGTRFTSRTPATSVSFGGTNGTVSTVTSTGLSHGINVIPPAHAAGTVVVSVTTFQGTSTANASYTYVVAPTITSISPNVDKQSPASTVYTITGTNLNNLITVMWDDQNVGIVDIFPTVVNSTTVTFKYGIEARRTAGNHNITVWTSGGVSNAVTVSIAGTPAITTLGTVSWVYNTRPAITVTGTNLSYIVSVTFNGIPGTVTIVNSTTITITPPDLSSLAAGTYPIVITDSFGVTTTSSFTILKPSVITSLSSTSGSIAGDFVNLVSILSSGASTTTIASINIIARDTSGNIVDNIHPTIYNVVGGVGFYPPTWDSSWSRTAEISITSTAAYGSLTSNTVNYTYGNYIKAYAMLWSGGGGGGLGSASLGGGGGGGGGLTFATVQLTLGSTYTVNVGAGGIGGSTPSAGTSSSLPDLSITGTGGDAGSNNGTGGPSGVGVFQSRSGGTPYSFFGGGGGGAGSTGYNANGSAGGGGGLASAYSNFGYSTTGGGGGGGGALSGKSGTGGIAGTGGGNGSNSGTAGGNGQNNTGGGGGGGGGIGTVIGVDTADYLFYTPGVGTPKTNGGTYTPTYYPLPPPYSLSFSVIPGIAYTGYQVDTNYSTYSPFNRASGMNILADPNTSSDILVSPNSGPIFYQKQTLTGSYVAASSFQIGKYGLTIGTLSIKFGDYSKYENCVYIGWYKSGTTYRVRVELNTSNNGLNNTNPDVIIEFQWNIGSTSTASAITMAFVKNNRGATGTVTSAGGIGGSGKVILYYLVNNKSAAGLLSSGNLSNSSASNYTNYNATARCKYFEFNTTTSTAITWP